MDQPQTAPARRSPSRGRARTWTRVLLATLVVILIVLAVVLAPRVRDFEKFLTGYWSGDPTFLQKAGLSEMFMYVAPPGRVGGKRCRQGYLVMVDTDGNMVSNQGIELEYRGAVGRWWSAFKSHFSARASETYRVPCVQVTYDDAEVMPSEMRLGLNVSEGTLALYDDGEGRKLYAFLVKDNEASNAANAEYDDAAE